MPKYIKKQKTIILIQYKKSLVFGRVFAFFPRACNSNVQPWGEVQKRFDMLHPNLHFTAYIFFRRLHVLL